VVLRLSGEMDVACEDIFQAACRDGLFNRPADVLVDLTGLTFIDSCGIRMLIELWDTCRTEALEMSILQGTGHVRRTLEIAGIDRVLPIADRGSSR
jgi:anti-anti-sigma factor